MIEGVILAAGASRRMGVPKLLLPLAGKPLIRHVAEAACRSLLDSVTVVTGAGADAIADAVKDLPVKLRHNSRWREGQAESLKAALHEPDPGWEAVMFLLADQPLVTPALVDSVIAAYREAATLHDPVSVPRRTIVCPFYDGRRGHPILFDWKAWKEALSALTGDQGARRILLEHPDCIVPVAVDREEILWDADTEEDYRRICAVFPQGPPPGKDR